MQTDAVTHNIVGPTMLGDVASVLAVVCANGCNNSQQYVTLNRECKRTKHVTSNNVWNCSLANKALRPFVWGVETPYFYLNKAWLSDSTKLIKG